MIIIIHKIPINQSINNTIIYNNINIDVNNMNNYNNNNINNLNLGKSYNAWQAFIY